MKLTMNAFLSMTLLAAALGGCATAPVVVRPGDKVEVGFTCRLPDGSLAASTRPVSELEGEQKSPWFLPHTGGDTEVLVAGGRGAEAAKERGSFEDEIMKRLEPHLAGLTVGQTAEVELKAERYPVSSPTDGQVSLALVRKRQKEMRLSKEEFAARKGKEPEPGQPFVIDPLVPGAVREVTDKEVVIAFAPLKDKPLVLPFGPVTVREKPEQYELVIQAEKGRMVRSGGMVGRISSIDNDRQLFTIDYGHPFGGEILHCAVRVESVIKPAPAAESGRDAGGGEPGRKETQAVPDREPEAAAEQGGVVPDLTPEAVKNVFDAGLERMLVMGGQVGARTGDLVTAHFTVSLEDGSLVTTTRREVAGDKGIKRVSWYREPPGYGPRELVAGKPEVMPGLTGSLVGMKGGEKKRTVLPPEKAYGQPDPQKSQQIPCSQSFPKTIRMPADEYVKRFSSFPVPGKEVQLMPYFASRVTGVTEKDVALEFLAVDGSSFEEPFGTLSAAVTDNTVTTTLKARVGAPFPLKEGFGIVSATDGTTFTVDLNNPLAGRTLVIDVEALSVAPAPLGRIDWIDDHDKGLALARQAGMPVFLVLHADWCGWCKKTFDETIPDPRITALKERFVWVRVNSDKEQKYKQQYGQEGYPMMVLLNPDGSVLKKIDGYREPGALREEIRAVLN